MRFLNKKSFTAIRLCLDNPNKTAYGYHWCTSLSKFDNIDLKQGKGTYVWCYETKTRYKSYREAAASINLGNRWHIICVTDKHDQTAGGYHWCTDLSVFDGVKLTAGGSSYNKSTPEFELLDFIEELGHEPIHGSRKLISPYEIDIYIPELNLAFEYNGAFWHDEEQMLKYKFKKPLSRETKTQMCKDKGITLIHIEEADYKKNKEKVLEMVRNLISVPV